MRAIEKRQRLIEYLNYLTHHDNVKSLYPIANTINSFTCKTSIKLPQSTAYRIIKQYIDNQNVINQNTLSTQVNDEILKIYNE